MDDKSNLAEASSGYTQDEAEAQHPGLDTSLPPASERMPEGDEIVLAQSAEEVEAQYVNRAGGPEPTEEGDAAVEDAPENDEGGGQYDQPAGVSGDGDGADGFAPSGGADADGDGFADALNANDEANA